ncbi:hypothetical protein [Bacillus sp. 1P06AnD]|uniref:hypothetical protein n=1 Tax=Bacillus sp. 1P06AnD TaxID=3132208 RepID=UPI0039A26465
MTLIAFGAMLICMVLAGLNMALSFNAGVFPTRYSLRRRAMLFLGIACVFLILGLVLNMWK